MALKVLIILLRLFFSGLLVGNELAVAVFIHPVLYSVSDEAHLRRGQAASEAIANRLAEHAPMLGSVSSRPGLAAYCGASLVDLVRPAGSVRPVLASADTAQRNSLPQRLFFYVEIDYLHPSPL